MCGRVFIKATFAELMRSFGFASAEEGLGQIFRETFNGAPSRAYPIIVRDFEKGTPHFIAARWGFIPPWSREPKPKIMPINAKAEGVRTSGMFRQAYRQTRCLMPIDGFFEWRATHGEKAKQPFAIAMKSGEKFALAGIWAARRLPDGIEERTFCVLTCAPNELMATVHDRMPVILRPEDYGRWISDEDDPADLMKPFPAELMTMWMVSRDVGNVRNDWPDLLSPIS